MFLQSSKESLLEWKIASLSPNGTPERPWPLLVSFVPAGKLRRQQQQLCQQR